MSEPFGEANNNNSVPTLAGYKINSGNIGDYVYKDSQFTLALTAGTGGGVPPGNYAWKLTNGTDTYDICNNDIVQFLGGNNISNPTISQSGSPASYTYTLSYNAVASGADRDIQFNDNGKFGTETNPVKIDTSGNIVTTQGVSTGEVHSGAYVLYQPSAADEFLGETDAGQIPKFYKLKLSTGSVGRQNGGPFQQHAFDNQSPPAKYGFPAENTGIVWTEPSHSVNAANGILLNNSFFESEQDCSFCTAPKDIPSQSYSTYAKNVRSFPLFGCDVSNNLDIALYDPLNLRCNARFYPAYTDVSFCSMGWNANNLAAPGLLKVTANLRGQWFRNPVATQRGNCVQIVCRCYDGAAAAAGTATLKWTQVVLEDVTSYGNGTVPPSPTPNGTTINASGTRWLPLYDLTSAILPDVSWAANDLLSFSVEVVYASPDPVNPITQPPNLFNIFEASVFAEYFCNP